MAKAVIRNMNYYEKLVKRVNQSMIDNPHSAMVMDMSNFKSLSKKLPETTNGISTVVFQKPSQRAAWIL